MIPPELELIVYAPLEKARRDQVNWVPAADLDLGAEENDAIVSSPDYSINVYGGVDASDEPFVTLNVLNSVGKSIHGVSLVRGERGHEVLNELFGYAARKTTGVDEALETLQELLNEDGTVGRGKRGM